MVLTITDVRNPGLATVTVDSNIAPRWATVAAFIDACAAYAEARRSPLPPDKVDMLVWKTSYDRVDSGRRKDRSSAGPITTAPERMMERDQREPADQGHDLEVKQVLGDIRASYPGTREAATRRLAQLAEEGRLRANETERAIRILKKHGLKDASGAVRLASDLALEALQDA